jgi:hypothetical protein
MKKQLFSNYLIAFLALALVFCQPFESQAQILKKLGEKQKKKEEDAQKAREEAQKKAEEAKIAERTQPYPQDFTDETGISGTYYAINGVLLGSNIYQKTLKINFLAKEEGKVVNKMKVYYEKSGRFESPYLDEKLKEKNITLFKCSNCNGLFNYSSYVNAEYYMAEPGVFILFEDNAKKVVDVWAKDKAQLEVYDLETAQAKYDQFKKQANSEIYEQKKKSLMSNYPTYKENIGKVVFVENYGTFNYQYSDKPTEDAKNFAKTLSMAKSIYWGAYLAMPMSVSCGETCLMNVVYEMEGIKTSREELRGKSRKWSSNISEKKVREEFCLNKGFQMISHRENIWDYAYVYLLYQNKDKFQLGKSYKMTTRIFTHKDGTDTEKVAEGSLMLLYDQAAQETMQKIFIKFEGFLNE